MTEIVLRPFDLKLNGNNYDRIRASSSKRRFLFREILTPSYYSELRKGLINVKKVLAVINATYAVAKRKPEKIRLAGIRTLTSAIPVQRSNQLSYQANCGELVMHKLR